MSRPKSKNDNPDKRLRPGVRVKVYVRDDMIGSGKVALLRMISETGSISAAAKEMGIGYRRAWFLIDTLQRCFRDPLIVTSRGGPGGTTLTDLGRDLLRRHAEMEARVAECAGDFLGWLEQEQPDGVAPE